MSRPLRIAINAQLSPNSGTGGIETALRVLAGVATLDDGDEEYVFVGPAENPDWLRPFVGPRATIVSSAPARTLSMRIRSAVPEPAKRLLRPLRALAAAGRHVVQTDSETISSSTGQAEGFFERLGCDVVHFPFQRYTPCTIPTIYNPHDLQHLHYPEFFSSEELARRGAEYPAACRDATVVVAGSRWVEDDIIAQYGVPRSKLQTIWWAPLPISPSVAAQETRDAETVQQALHLPEQPFMLYPAMTWEHKNHLRLIDAVARVRDERGLTVTLVCTGHKTEFWPTIERAIAKHGLQQHVHFPGLLPHEQIGALYRAAAFVIVPTLFEAASAPLFEAWQRGKAVACSTVTSLPEQAAGAALLFNPFNVNDIADAIIGLWKDDELRTQLEQRGLQRMHYFKWERMARAYRALYRKVAGRVLSEEDCELLATGRQL